MNGLLFLRHLYRDHGPTHLTQQQAERLYERIHRDWEYFAKLKARLEALGYDGTLLDRDVSDAERAMHQLSLLVEVMAERGHSGEQMRKLAAKPTQQMGSCWGDEPWPAE
jgi:hypothetical protein